MRKRFTILASLMLVLITLTACLGPKPSVELYKAEAPQKGSSDPYKVEVVITNIGPGGGQVEVQVNLSNKQTGELISQDSKNIELQKDDKLHVFFQIDLPPSAQDIDPQNIKVDVQANYPIE